MKQIIPLLIALFALPVSAKIARQHAAHQHGTGKLGIAFEGQNGTGDFRIATSSIMGFEYTPKTGREKKLKEMQLDLLENKINDMISFPQELKCVFKKEKMVVEKDEKESKELHAVHRDLTAVFDISCEKSPLGSKITFNFQKYFPNIHDLDVDVLIGDLQKAVEVKSSGTVLELVK
jgi:hypothetical protein